MDNLKEGWALVIETNSYAGNFERDLCAHVTGIVGDEDNTGEEYVDKGVAEMFESRIKQCADDHACYRPVEICGEEANDLAIFFYEKPTEEEIKVIKERSATFVEKRRNSGYSWDKDFSLKILGFSVVEKTNTIASEKV